MQGLTPHMGRSQVLSELHAEDVSGSKAYRVVKFGCKEVGAREQAGEWMLLFYLFPREPSDHR